VRDQQLSSRLGGQPALRPRADRLGKVLDAGSKAGIRSTVLTTVVSSARSARSPLGNWSPDG
jgi:hypothetical protein